MNRVCKRVKETEKLGYQIEESMLRLISRQVKLIIRLLALMFEHSTRI